VQCAIGINRVTITDVMANLFVDVHPSKPKLTSFLDSNCFLVASTISEYSFQQMLLSVLADGRTNSLGNASYDCCGRSNDITVHGIWDKQNPNMR
jgi:hypothetical protein